MRIVLSLLLCHIIAVFVFFLELSPPDWEIIISLSFFRQLSDVTIFITRFIGIPAIICTALMEVLGRRYLQKSKIPQTIPYVVIGSCLGSLSGFLVFRTGYFVILGAVIGLIVSSIKAKLHLIERKQRPSTTVDTA
jgi:hypothetical protein